ncbi:hypothetical protein CR513_43575, partial [Mucuna pruriens]
MRSSSIDLENLSPKTKMMIEYMKKLEEKIEKLGRLESMRLDTQSVNAKVNALSKGNEKEKHKSRRESEGMRRASIESWDELKREICKRFIPSFYTRDVFVKLQRMYQGSKSVEKYFKEMEMTRIRA